MEVETFAREGLTLVQGRQGMQIGAGVIVDIVHVTPDRWWLDTWDSGRDDMRTCALYCDPGSERPQVGDNVWWTDDYCFWTPSDESRSTVVLRKLGEAGAPHPGIPPADQRRRIKLRHHRLGA